MLMKKILSLITAFVLCTSFVSAKTIYCKMEQSWWKVDNAAVGCHYWGTPGPGTSWPGVRMTPVEGETDLWSIELDTDKVQNVIFTRVNPSGAIADWGAKTKDLQIPTDDKNLFTITTSSASWGNPGCEGEWSVYGGAVEKPKHDYTITVYLPAFCDDIAAYADSVRVMGGFDDWSNGIYMQKIVDEDFNDCWVAEIKDVEEDTEFKLRFGTDADWKVQVQLNGANMANEAFGETTDIVLHYDGEGYGFAACAAPVARKEFVFIAGAAADSDPAMFAITWGKDGSSETVKMEKQEEALYAADILATVDSVVLVRCATGATEIIWGEGTNVWNQTANYALCDTMYFGEWTEEGLFTLTCEAPKPVEVKYYVTGNAALVGEEKAWQADAIEMVDYTHTFPMLAAGEYQLKVTDGTWEHAWGYDNLSPTVAVEGLYTDVDGNICFTVYTPNDVTVTFAQGYVVVTGDFKNPTPATPDFGLLVNGTDYLPGTPEDKDTYTEYAVNTQLTVGEFVQLYDNVNKAAWTVTPEGSGFTDFDIHDNAYYIKQTGSYQFYIKIPKEGMESGLYVGFQGTGSNLNKVKAAQGQRFNVLGLPVDANYRGVVIMNGQTYLQ